MQVWWREYLSTCPMLHNNHPSEATWGANELSDINLSRPFKTNWDRNENYNSAWVSKPIHPSPRLKLPFKLFSHTSQAWLVQTYPMLIQIQHREAVKLLQPGLPYLQVGANMHFGMLATLMCRCKRLVPVEEQVRKDWVLSLDFPFIIFIF